MKKGDNRRTGILWAMAVTALFLVGTCFLGISGSQSPFHAVTVELGTEQVRQESFYTDRVLPEKVRFETNLQELDLSAVKEYEICISYDGKLHYVPLKVVDTTAPKVQFRDLFVYPGEMVRAEDFVSSVEDYSQVSISFKKSPMGERDQTVLLVVRDAAGNWIQQDCTLRYAWLRPTVVLELGEAVEPGMFLYDPDGDDLTEQQLEEIAAFGVGEHTVTSQRSGQTLTCRVHVQDTMGPVLETQNVELVKGETVTLESFVLSSWDPSGIDKMEFLSLPDPSVLGIQPVEIAAVDTMGNRTAVQLQLTVLPDGQVPVFAGVEDLLVHKNETVDFTAGVVALDAQDGILTFTVDPQTVDLTKPGTYFISYRASDADGNVTQFKRRVTVRPDAEDLADLVAEIAESLPNDVIEIRDYIRESIRYDSTWGGEDPCWYGFTQKKGNCYVHALCMQEILKYKGWESQLIWVTGPDGYEFSHYWLIVKVDGVWKHVDGTPTDGHDSYYDLMSDAQRYETLVKDGIFRDWDRTQWPVCP